MLSMTILYFCPILLLSYTTAFTSKFSSRCGDWIPFKDEKCFIIAEKTECQTQQEAERICDTYAEDLKGQSLPKLITIQSQEEEKFLSQLLFVENEIFENVWLGLKAEEGMADFRWSDGSEVDYSMWANQNVSDVEHKCVQMTSGKRAYEIGEWVKVHCETKGFVICERRQTWTLEDLQNQFLSYKLKQDRMYEETREELDNLKLRLINEMNKISVPVGFIYVQLVGQQSPTVLWPHTKWTDVTSTYAGLFFRAEGGNSAPFGQIQDENTKRLLQVHQKNDQGHVGLLTIPNDGTWSGTIHTARLYNAPDKGWVGFRFRLTTGEVRPRNQAVKIWKRI